MAKQIAKKVNAKEMEFEYNPVKEEGAGLSNEKVVWSTKALERAREGVNQGLKLKSNPFIGSNTQLFKPDLVRKYTQEELDDILHCMQDPVYFAEKCYLMTPEGLQRVKLRDYQVDYLKHLQNNRFSVFLSCRQSGKCLNLLTNVCIKVKNDNKTIVNRLKKYYLYTKEDYVYISLPLFEIYNLYCKQTLLWKVKYKLYKTIYKLEKHKKHINFLTNILYNVISIIDKYEYKFVNNILLDGYKTIIDIDITDQNIDIETDTGFSPITNILISKPFEQYKITLENNYSLIGADKHIVFDKNYNEIFLENLKVNDYIVTDNGFKKVTKIEINKTTVSMCDLSVNDNNHRFYSNGILSHNSTTTAIFCLWKALFTPDLNALILSKSGAAGADLISKIKDMYLFLPDYLKIGVQKWNQSGFSFDNKSQISTEAFSPTAGLGKTINFLILDEFAWCPPNEVELFYNNIIPTVTTITNSNVCIMSTQNGHNLFYNIWQNAITKKNIYAPFKVDWYQVPQYNPTTKQWDKRDEKWKKDMIGVLGSEEAFYYQYGTQFLTSDKCILSREKMSQIKKNEVLFIPKMEEFPIYIRHRESLVFHPDFTLDLLLTRRFIIIVDLAEGGGGDFTVFHIFMINNDGVFEQVGYWKSNSTDLEMAALEFWLIYAYMFNNDRCLISIEWNTYGALFYRYLLDLNETDYMPEFSYRFNIAQDIDLGQIIQYKKASIEEEVVGVAKHRKTVPGIRWNGSNKITACALLKIMFEKNEINVTDIETIGELERFEDKSGNGSYKASTGHDDLAMTLVQIPMIKQTSAYKNFIEELKNNDIQADHTNNFNPYIRNQFNTNTIY